MKIVNIKVTAIRKILLKTPYWNSIIRTEARERARVEITTDEGIVGMAPCKAGTRRDIEGIVKSKLLGRDPLRTEELWQLLYMGGTRKPIHKGGFIASMSVVDNALWDLKGKALGQPVWKLAGGAQATVKVYAAGGYYGEGKGVPELCRELESFVSEGFRAVKMKVGWSGIRLREDAERVRAARKALGPDIDLMIDANNAWDASTAVRFGRMVEDAEPYWFEEPVHADDIDGARKVADALDMPVASGENEQTRYGFRDLIERGGAEIVQADPNDCGGISEWLKIAALAAAHHLPMAPHGNAPVGCTCVAAVSNGLITEHYSAGLGDPMMGLPDFRGGMIQMGDEPGLGIHWDEDYIARNKE
jgi:L-alanine-DL-glutamate epimerase-like enolase superfamily enzyme